MECQSCGAELPANARFCPGCAAPVAPDSTERPAADPLREALEAAVGGDFDVLRLLGRGGMGAVYLARERALDRLVAIKVLPPESSDPDRQDRFRREAKTAAKLAHPNIVPLHSFGEADGMLYFVLGYVEGQSLGDRLRSTSRMSEEETRQILTELADALAYAHTQGGVHRDIKPDNVLLDQASGRAMLTDFGIAKAPAAGATLTQLGTVVGTPEYMSPEQASGDRHIDGRSDIYALGIVGYRMLTGRLPFEGDSVQQVIAQHISKEAVPLRRMNPEVSEELEKAIGRCLAKAREDRWSDASQFGRALAKQRDPMRLLKKRNWFDGWVFDSTVPSAYVIVAIIVAFGGRSFAGGGTAASDTSAVAPADIPERVGPVNDFADVLDPEMEDSIAALLAEVRESTGGEIVVVTVDRMNAASPGERDRLAAEISRGYEREWDVGRGRAEDDTGDRRGVVLLLAPGHQPGDGWMGYGMARGRTRGYVTSAESREILGEMRQAAVQSRRYGPGLLAGIRLVGDQLESRREVSLGSLAGGAFVRARGVLQSVLPPVIMMLTFEPRVSESAVDTTSLALVIAAILLTPVIAVLAVAVGVAAHRRRMSWRDVSRQLLRQPSWWTGWFPAALRHPASADAWARATPLMTLTATTVNLLGIHLLVSLLYMLGQVVGGWTGSELAAFDGWPGHTTLTDAAAEMESHDSGHPDVPATTAPMKLIVFNGLLLVVAAGYLTTMVRHRRLGLGFGWLHRLADGSAMRPTAENLLRWIGDEMQAAFPPPTRSKTAGAEERAPRTPSQITQAIEVLVPELAGQAREIGSEALATARSLLKSLRATEEEIERLARDVTPGDLQSARDKLQTLGPPRDGEDEEQRRMRELTASQLELFERLEQRLHAASDRRDRMIELLRTLWLHLAELRAGTAQDASESSEVTQEIRVICGDIRVFADAQEEVTDLLAE